MPVLNRIFRLLLTAALLAAWQGALLHPLKHVDARGGFVHVAGSNGGGPDDKGKLNPLCDAITAVAACIGGSANLPIAALEGAESFLSGHGSAPRSAPAPAYRSQAPPSLL